VRVVRSLAWNSILMQWYGGPLGECAKLSPKTLIRTFLQNTHLLYTPLTFDTHADDDDNYFLYSLHLVTTKLLIAINLQFSTTKLDDGMSTFEEITESTSGLTLDDFEVDLRTRFAEKGFTIAHALTYLASTGYTTSRRSL
jgi:hypothetical protein